MAIIGVRGQGKRPQRTEKVMLGVPFRGRVVMKAWPRKRTQAQVNAQLEQIARMAIINWLAKFISPCQKGALHHAAKHLHMLEKDLTFQTLSNRMFAPEDGKGKRYWPDLIASEVTDAMAAFGTADNQLLVRGKDTWSHTNAAGTHTAAVWQATKSTIIFNKTVA